MKTTHAAAVLLVLASGLALVLSACVQSERDGGQNVAVDSRALPTSKPSAKTAAKPTSKPAAKPATKPSAKPAAKPQPGTNQAFRTKPMTADELPKTEDEWRKILTAEEFQVLREKDTERQYAGYWDNKSVGSYYCAGCGEHLFESGTKFESGTGWPSFYKPATEAAVGIETDSTLGMVRSEVHCKNCKGHLGHVFDDGPRPTGLRYCINSVSLKFKENDKK